MKIMGAVLLCWSVVLGVATPALAHHSAAAFDTQKEVKVTGTVTQYRFANPHIYLTIQVKKEDGSTQSMEVEAGAASVLNGLGFTKNSVSVGEQVTIVGNPARSNPNALLLGRELYKKDGTYVPLNIASRGVEEAKTSSAATASTIAGTWFAPRSEFGGFLGGAGRWPLTDKGKAAAASGAGSRNQSLTNCVPLGAPALMLYPVADTITVQKDRVVMKVDWMDSERVVYTDGRKHPPASETFLQGHSVGRFEGTTLVVETTNFKDNAMGLSMALPGSTQKRLTERFALGDDRKTLVYSGVLEDPIYLSQPVQWSSKLEYRPAMVHSNQKCDPEVARKFLSEK
ncbi:MAG TPA: DUF6152 family protein [Vicinamibacterales bacterium]|jgi:hypothetical protein